MKKILLTFLLLTGVFFVTEAPSFALTNYACVAPYGLSSTWSSKISRVSGVNFLSEKIAEQILKNQLTKNANGNFSVDVKSFSPADLKAGRFKSMEIYGSDINADGVHFSSLDVKTLCDFNYIIYNQKNSNAIFKEALPLSFGAIFSEDDLNKTMQDVGYGKLIDKVNSFGKNSGLFDIKSTSVKIKDNKFIYVFNVNVPLMNLISKSNFSLELITDLNVENGEVQLSNPKIKNSMVNADLATFTKFFNYLNPLEYSLNIMENKNADLRVQNVRIVNNKVNVTGTINIAKDELTQK